MERLRASPSARRAEARERAEEQPSSSASSARVDARLTLHRSNDAVMSGSGQNAKNSHCAYVGGSTPDNGHCSARLVRQKSARTGKGCVHSMPHCVRATQPHFTFSFASLWHTSICWGRMFRSCQSPMGSSARLRHSSARSTISMSKPVGTAVRKNATASSFDAMRPVRQLMMKRAG